MRGMKRRTFLGTLTALAGVALAKIKAPAAPKYIAGCDPAFSADESAIVVQRITPDDVANWYRPPVTNEMYVFTDKKVWLSTPDGFREFTVSYIPDNRLDKLQQVAVNSAQSTT